MSEPRKTLSVEQTNALYTFSRNNQEQSTQLHMVEAPHISSDVPNVHISFLAARFADATMTINFAQKSPKVSAFLNAGGYLFTDERRTDNVRVIDITYPNTPTETPITTGSFNYLGVDEEFYTACDFIGRLASRTVLFSVNKTSHVDLHDEFFHRPMWDILSTVEPLAEALRIKALQVITGVRQLPARTPNLLGPEDDELALRRAVAKNNLGGLMGGIDYVINTGGPLASTVLNGSAKSIAFVLRSHLFSSSENPFSPILSKPDEFISDSELYIWAQQLVEDFSPIVD
jgi:hypothetical protein